VRAGAAWRRPVWDGLDRLEAVVGANFLLGRAVLTRILVVVAAVVAAAQNAPILSFVNCSGGGATLKIGGRVAGYVEIPNGASRAGGISGGAYTIVMRFGAPDNYLYQRASSSLFRRALTVWTESRLRFKRFPNGNCHTEGASSSDF
jgi:hypothetical protein